VLCFSSEYNNIILWSHYARNHTGMLIKFDTTSIPVNASESLSKYLLPVEYKDDMIEIPGDFMDLDKEKKLEIIKKNTHRKYTDWQYEGEYRGVVSFDHTENKRYIDLPPVAILEVVVGLHCALETELNVKSILQRDEYRHVKLKRSFLHSKKYMMEYREMNI
jgi:hypothetical protein